MAKQHKTAGASPPTSQSMEDEIRYLAYQLYCDGGCQDGRDLEHWLEAEQRVMVRRTPHLRRVV
jgi:Protein of unknown function (DUF2934)